MRLLLVALLFCKENHHLLEESGRKTSFPGHFYVLSQASSGTKQASASCQSPQTSASTVRIDCIGPHEAQHGLVRPPGTTVRAKEVEVMTNQCHNESEGHFELKLPDSIEDIGQRMP